MIPQTINFPKCALLPRVIKEASSMCLAITGLADLEVRKKAATQVVETSRNCG